MEEQVLGIPFPERSRALTPGECPLTKARSWLGAAKIILGVPSLVGKGRYSLLFDEGSPIGSRRPTFPKVLPGAGHHAKVNRVSLSILWVWNLGMTGAGLSLSGSSSENGTKNQQGNNNGNDN